MLNKTSKKPTATAHCLVKNEENFIWYAIMSVLPYVDKMIVFDTGSTDKTVSLIKEILKTKLGKQKIHFEEKGEVDKQGHTDLRNEMIKMTKTDWFMILDGDEVWPAEEIEYLLNNELSDAIKTSKGVVMVNYHLCNIDLKHYSESGHFFAPWGYHGHFTYRLFRNFSGISWKGEYLKDKLFYNKNVPVNSRKNTFYSTAYFWHLSKLKRSSKDSLVIFRKKPSKLKYLPKFIGKIFLKVYPLAIPKIFYANKN